MLGITCQGVKQHLLVIDEGQAGADAGGAEVGGGLGLHHGACQEAPANLSPPTVLYYRLVPRHGRQPVVVLW